MSYEGYVQYLCKAGHYQERDCMQDTPTKCCRGDCYEPIVWWNGVDITNGSYEGRKRIDGYIKLKEKTRRECGECNSVLEITYEIPRKKGYSVIEEMRKELENAKEAHND